MKMLKKYPKDKIERNEFYVDPGLVNKADYQEPVKTKIGKIPVIITDPHNEVLPFWNVKPWIC